MSEELTSSFLFGRKLTSSLDVPREPGLTASSTQLCLDLLFFAQIHSILLNFAKTHKILLNFSQLLSSFLSLSLKYSLWPTAATTINFAQIHSILLFPAFFFYPAWISSTIVVNFLSCLIIALSPLYEAIALSVVMGISGAKNWNCHDCFTLVS